MEDRNNHDHNAIFATHGVNITPSPQAGDNPNKKFKISLHLDDLLGTENRISRAAGYLKQSPLVIDSIILYGFMAAIQYEATTKASMDHFASSIASLSHLQELVIYSVPPILAIPIMDFLSDKNAKAQLSKRAVHGVDGDFSALASFLQRSTNTHLNHLEISQLRFNLNEITNLCNALKTCTSI